MAVGFVTIIVGIFLNAASYSQAGFLVGGFGVIIVIVGIVRLLIGFINPATPDFRGTIVANDNCNCVVFQETRVEVLKTVCFFRYSFHSIPWLCLLGILCLSVV